MHSIAHGAETSALKLFTVANLRYKLSWWYQTAGYVYFAL